MAFVVPTKKGAFEVRESYATPDGPRSRTLATFHKLTDEVVEKARARAAKPASTEELKEAALRAGAPVASSEVDEAARETLRLLASDERPDPMLRRLLLDALLESDRPADTAVSEAARAATEWIGASLTRRGDALRDLLLLADALPIGPRAEEIDFPKLRSA